jgi:hypothetical protein
MKFYVYVVFRPDGRPLYIGKGSGDRWRRHDRKARNPHYANVFEQAGRALPVVIVRDQLSEDDAYAVEEALTRAVGIEKDGGPLVNLGYGGRGGAAGIKHSEEWRAVRSLRAREMWRDPEIRAKLLRPDRQRAGNKQPRSDEFKSSMSRRLIGNTHTLGYKPTEATRAKQSVALKGQKRTAATREAMSRSARIAHARRRGLVAARRMAAEATPQDYY